MNAIDALTDAIELDRAADCIRSLLTFVQRIQTEQPQRHVISPAAVGEAERLITLLKAKA